MHHEIHLGVYMGHRRTYLNQVVYAQEIRQIQIQHSFNLLKII